MRRLIAGLMVTGTLAGAASAQPGGGGGGGPPPAKVLLDAARIESVEQWREVTGELRSPRRSTLAAEEEGLMIEVRVEAGDAVSAGDVLARLDDTLIGLEVTRLEAVLASRLASVEARRADLQRYQRDLARMEVSAERGSATVTELDSARTGVALTAASLDVAKAETEAARAEVEWARQRQLKMTIRAPFSGRVVSKLTEVGQWVSRGDPVAGVVQLDRLEAWIQIPERFAARVAPDGGVPESSADASQRPPVEVRVPATGQIIRSPISRLVPDVDPLSRLVPARVDIENDSGLLKPGMSISALVPTGASEPTLTVHKDGILRDDAGTYLYYDAGGVAAPARVTVLFATSDRVAIRSAVIREGTRIVVEGNERMFPGQPLMDMAAPVGGVGAGGGEAGGGGGGGGR